MKSLYSEVKLRVPPALVLLIHFGLAWLCASYLSFANFSFLGQKVIAITLGLIGSVLTLIAIYSLHRAGTTVDPICPSRASSLNTHGIFSISRNPIYLALLLILTAWIVWLGNGVAVLLAGTFVWHLTYFQISAEEHALKEKFGEDYSEYMRKVRRWI